jgi:hypothetical protein
MAPVRRGHWPIGERIRDRYHVLITVPGRDHFMLPEFDVPVEAMPWLRLEYRERMLNVAPPVLPMRITMGSLVQAFPARVQTCR